jgi:hypothetical protein
MVFTSPPYFKKTKPTEKYEQMPEYADRDDFNERFLFPVIRNTYEHLKTGGVYALNIPIDMYEDVKTVLGATKEKIPLVLRPRGKTAKNFGSEYKEFIYVWRKGGASGGENPNSPSGGQKQKTFDFSAPLPPPTWKHDFLVAKKSSIPNAGRGVFATQPIKKGQRLFDYVGVKMKRNVFNRKYPNDRRYYYSAGIFDVIDGHNHKTENISHYINESSRPNVVFMKKGVVATKNIREGEELFLTYPKNYPREDYKK